jgi:signal transduction histidine kinase
VYGMVLSPAHRSRDTRILVAAVPGLLLGLGWLALSFWFLQSFQRADAIRFKVNRIRIQLLEARRREKDFMLRSLSDPAFYQDGRSPYLDFHAEAMTELRRDADDLSRMVSGRRDDMRRLHELLEEYDGTFHRLVDAYRRRGLHDTGLEGDWRKSTQALQRAFEQTENVTLQRDLLEMRKDEKDFLLRGDVKYLRQVRQDASHLRDAISRLVPDQASVLLPQLDRYERDVEAYHTVQQQIGLNEDLGLLGKFRNAAHAVEPLVERVYTEEVATQQEASHRLTIGLVLAAALLTVLLTTTFALTATARSHLKRVEEINKSLREQSEVLEQNIAERQRAEKLLRHVASAVSGTGKVFFETLVQSLVEGLDADYGFVAELLPNNRERVRTMGAFACGKLVDDFEYDLANTPCENVVGKQLCLYRNGVQALFPKDHLLVEMGVQGYAGTPLFEARGRALGLLVVLYRRPLEQPELVASMLRIFAARAAAELERLRASEALARTNQALRGRSAELTQANQDLRDATAELARSNAELQQFAYVASHDLQEPLRAVAGCIQLLEERLRNQLDARGDELIGHVVDGATRMQTLIDDLLMLSRVGTRPRAFTPTDMGAVLEEVRSNLAVALEESGASLTSGILPTITADPPQMIQLLQNLIGNAVKFRGEQPPVIRVGAERKDTSWVFSVADNGIGVEPQYFERIFLLFQRLHTRRNYPGTGIGLAICKKIVERHGGRIWVESTPGQGATFFFTIPDRISI